MKLSSLVILGVLAGAASGARAETVVVSGVELRLPSEWERKVEGAITMLRPKKYRGRAIEVIALKTMPPASPDAFKALLGGERLELTTLKEATVEGTKVIGASGKLVTPKGTKVDVDVLVVSVESRAVMLVSFVGADQDPVIRKANRDILGSARIPGPRISVAFQPPKKAGLTGPPKPVVEKLTKLAQGFDQLLRLPRPLAIMFEECGVVNAFYSPTKHSIQMCHELYDDNLKLFAGVGMDQPSAQRTADGAFMWTFLHEFGHALVGELSLPVTGKGEDIADEIATLMLSRSPKTQEIALAGAAWFDAKIKQPGHRNPYWSTHSFDSVRFESILCLLYGSDKGAFAQLMKHYKVPPSKLAKCERDTPLRVKAWEKMLEPYAVKK